MYPWTCIYILISLFLKSVFIVFQWRWTYFHMYRKYLKLFISMDCVHILCSLSCCVVMLPYVFIELLFLTKKVVFCCMNSNLFPGLYWLEQIFIMLCKYAMFLLLSMWAFTEWEGRVKVFCDKCAWLCLLLFPTVVLFLSLMKVGIMSDLVVSSPFAMIKCSFLSSHNAVSAPLSFLLNSLVALCPFLQTPYNFYFVTVSEMCLL